MHKHGSLAAKDVITLEKKAKEETRPRANTGIEFGQYSMTTAVVQGPKKKLSIFYVQLCIKRTKRIKSMF